LEVQREKNDELGFSNLRCVLAYVISAYAIYLLFNAGFLIFNIIPAVVVGLIAALVAGDNWGFKSGYNLVQGERELRELTDFLTKIQQQLNGVLDEPWSSVSDNNESIQQVDSNESNWASPSEKFFVFLFVTIVILTVAYIIKSTIFPLEIRSFFKADIPLEVSQFVEKKEGCDHFLGELPSDDERKRFLKENIRKFCPGTDQELDALRKKYAENKGVMEKLAVFSNVGILETGQAIGERYEGLRKKLLTNNWKPWKFVPVNNYVGPFPEVMTCDEGYCHGYFINKSGKLVLEVTYKICGSDYIDSCPGYENGFLKIEDYETISLDEARERNKIAKDHFE
jgi:hypothetical protein